MQFMLYCVNRASLLLLRVLLVYSVPSSTASLLNQAERMVSIMEFLYQVYITSGIPWSKHILPCV